MFEFTTTRDPTSPCVGERAQSAGCEQWSRCDLKSTAAAPALLAMLAHDARLLFIYPHEAISCNCKLSIHRYEAM